MVAGQVAGEQGASDEPPVGSPGFGRQRWDGSERLGPSPASPPEGGTPNLSAPSMAAGHDRQAEALQKHTAGSRPRTGSVQRQKSLA